MMLPHTRIAASQCGRHRLCRDRRRSPALPRRPLGKPAVDVQYADKVKQYGATSAPLVVRDEVIVGTSGGDSGVRGFVAAYDAKKGTMKWRSWTIPGPEIWVRQLAGRCLPARRWHNLDARHLRSRTEHLILDDQQRRARF